VKKKIVLDSYALLAYLKKENNYLKVKGILSSHDKTVMMNELNIGEVYYILARNRGREQADYFLEVILRNLPVKVIANTFDMIIEASRIKAAYAMSYMDCFVAATAALEKASVLTGDPEFKRIDKIVNVDWM